MKGTATVRELRNRFTEVRQRLEAEGEVLAAERGRARYRLTLYEPAPPQDAAIDYWARLVSYQPKPLTKSQSRKLHAENRGDR